MSVLRTLQERHRSTRSRNPRPRLPPSHAQQPPWGSGVRGWRSGLLDIRGSIALLELVEGTGSKGHRSPPPPPVWVLAPGLPWIRWPRFPAGEAPGWGTKTHVSSLVGRTGCLQEGGKQGEGGRRQIPGPSRGSSRRDSLAGLAPVLSSSWWGLLGPSQGPPPRARRALSYPSPQPGLSWRLLLPLLIIFH